MSGSAKAGTTAERHTCELRVLIASIVRAPPKRASGESFSPLTKDLHGRLTWRHPEIGICRPDARCRQTGGSLALSMSSNPHGHRWIRSRWPPLYGRRNGRPPHRPGVKIEKLEPGHVAEAGD